MLRSMVRRFSTSLKSASEYTVATTDSFAPQDIPLESYQFNTLTSLSSSFNPIKQADVKPTLKQYRADDFPEGMDASDVRDIMNRLQKADIERELSSAVDFDERRHIVRRAATDMLRKEKLWLQREKNYLKSVESCATLAWDTAALYSKFNVREVLDMLTMYSNIDTSGLAIYNSSKFSNTHKYMIFFTCRNDSHIHMISHGIYGMLKHHKVIPEAPLNRLQIQDNNSDPWLIMDLGDILIHLSFGPARQIQGLERVLATNDIPLGEWRHLSDVTVNQCIMISHQDHTTEAHANAVIKNIHVEAVPSKEEIEIEQRGGVV